MVFTGTGTVLKGTPRARVVTWASPCTNTAGTAATAGVHCDSDEQKSSSVTVISPSTKLDVTASALVTYTFVETNDGNSDLTPPAPGSRESVISFEAGQVCDSTSPVTYTGGDTGSLLVLSPGEAWTFTCKGTLSGPAGDDDGSGSSSSTLTAVGHGCDATGADVTSASSGRCGSSGKRHYDEHERDRVKVTIDYFPRGPS